MKTSKKHFISLFVIIIVLSLVSSSIVGCSNTEGGTPTGSATSPDDSELIEALSQDQLSEEDRDAIIHQLLKNCLFYQGRVTVFEDQKWTSRGSDGSSGVGDTTVSTDEILVYDREANKTYIIARYMSATGWHRVTVNDMRGDFIGDFDIVHSGELYEYYGTGLLWRKNLEPVIASESTPLADQYRLNFSANPVRMDNERSVIFTYPIPRQVDWVTYVSIAGTDRRGGVRMWPPEENGKNPDLDLVPTLTTISDSNPYNTSESWLYEATDRIWIPSGVFSYDYYQVSYADAMSELERLAAEVSAAGSFGAMAADMNLSDAWQQTAEFADGMQAVATAVNDLNTVAQAVSASAAQGDLLEVLNAADALVNEPSVESNIKELKEGMAAMSATGSDDSALRNLEGFIIESSEESDAGVQQKNLENNFSPLKPRFEKLFADFTTVYDSLQPIISQLRSYAYYGQDRSLEEVNELLSQYQAAVNAALKLNQHMELLLGDIGIVLFDMDAAGTFDRETEFGELNRLFTAWGETFLFMETTDIDMEAGVGLPAGYPVGVVPVVDGAIITISQRIPGEDGEADGFNVTLKSGMDIDDVIEFYTELLQDTEDFSSFAFSGMTTLSGLSNGYEFGVVIMPNNLGGAEKTVVQINLTPVE